MEQQRARQKMPIRPIPHQPDRPQGQTLHVSVMTVSGYPQPTTSGWKDCAANADGSYTLQLYPGRNVVKVQAGDAVRCFVLHAVASSVVIENVTNPGSAIKAGDTAKGLPIAML